jgi:hypothetical protein
VFVTFCSVTGVARVCELRTYGDYLTAFGHAPIVVEDPSFPGMQQFQHSFTLRDEIYHMKDCSRDKMRVLMRLDVSKLDMKNNMSMAPTATSL